MFVLVGLLLHRHGVDLALLLGDVAASLTLGLIHRVEDHVGEAPVAGPSAVLRLGGLLIAHRGRSNLGRGTIGGSLTMPGVRVRVNVPCLTRRSAIPVDSAPDPGDLKRYSTL